MLVHKKNILINYQPFDAANEDDELIWIRDYTNFADTPSLIIPSGKKFTLYLSYIQSIPVTPVYYQYYFIDENNNQTYEDIQLPYVYAPYSANIKYWCISSQY